MANITLKQLRYAVAVAEHGHFGHAAAASAISQPALSMQIQALEDGLGLALFERAARHVRPTPVWGGFLARAQRILAEVDDLGDSARAARGDDLGRLRLGVIPTIAPYLLPRVVGLMGQYYPQANLALRETITPRLISELSEGRLDAAIVALPISEPSFEEVEVFQEDFILVRPPEDAGKPVPDANSLREMKLLLLEEGHCFRDQALSFCALGANTPREVMDGSSLSTLVQMVGAGIGVTLIPEMAVPVETRSASVALARFRTPAPARKIGVIWRRTSPLSNQLRKLANVVREAAETGAPRP
jgi:LysR family hydrogen peroxide-inducible transcriptional activator